jgi:hypothetical protein
MTITPLLWFGVTGRGRLGDGRGEDGRGVGGGGEDGRGVGLVRTWREDDAGALTGRDGSSEELRALLSEGGRLGVAAPQAAAPVRTHSAATAPAAERSGDLACRLPGAAERRPDRELTCARSATARRGARRPI